VIGDYLVDCPNCKRNQLIAAQMRGLADSIVVGGLTAVGVPAAAAAAAPSLVEAGALKATGRRRRKNGWNAFLKRYVANYKRTQPRGRKSFGTLSKEAARKWKRAKR
jgi:hypothetical protein